MKQINVPDYINSLYEKLLSFLSGEITSGLEEKQLYGVMLASAYATYNNSFINYIVNCSRDYVDVSTINAAKSAAALTGVKFDHKGLPCPESEIIIENLDEEYLRAFHTPLPHTQVSECNKNQKDDIDFQLYLLAASFIADFNLYTDIRAQLIQEKLVGIHAINTVIHIAAIMQPIAEIIEHRANIKKKILVVDDEKRMTRLLKNTLERTGKFEVRTENKGSNAVNAARTFKPDLILLDMIMPDMGGESVADEIREDEELNHIKIVFLTASLTKDETGNTGKIIGRHLFLAKPIRDDDLIHCIDNKLGNM